MKKKNIFLRIVNILVLIFFKATPNYDTISKIPDARILKLEEKNVFGTKN